MRSAPVAVMTMVSSAPVPAILTEDIENSPVGAGPRGSSSSGCTERGRQYRHAPRYSWTAATTVRIVATKNALIFQRDTRDTIPIRRRYKSRRLETTGARGRANCRARPGFPARAASFCLDGTRSILRGHRPQIGDHGVEI